MPKASFPSVVPLPCGLLEQIRLPPAIMVLGTLPMRTHASHTASNSTTAITVGIRRLQT